jgi:YwhD family.
MASDLTQREADAMDRLNKSGSGGAKRGFTLLNTRTDVHAGFGRGVVDLSAVAPVIIDGEEAYIDLGALHAKSAVERGIRWTTNRSEVPNGKPYWVVWVTVGKGENGPYYKGVAASYMEIDHEARRGYKILAEHVNRMDASLKGRIVVDEMDAQSKAVLRAFLMRHNPQMWANSPDELKAALA